VLAGGKKKLRWIVDRIVFHAFVTAAANSLTEYAFRGCSCLDKNVLLALRDPFY
jgi:hypothetical protein